MKKEIHYNLLTLSAVLALSLCLSATGEQKLSQIEGQAEGYLIAEGLSGPDGLVFHPETDELYIVEETANRISVLRDGKVIPVINQTFTPIKDIPEWSITRDKNTTHWFDPQLKSPEGIAFGQDGKLYVTEDTPNGRLLEFWPNVDGTYTDARPVPIPWFSRPYSWEGLTSTKDGRLFVAGSTAEYGPGLFFGTVLMRDPSGSWWVVDYGPFASFSSLAVSSDENILLVGDEASGTVMWWDALRHKEIGSLSEMLPNVESLATMLDGSILAVQESQMKVGDQLKGHNKIANPGRVVRIYPETEEIKTFAKGFGLLEGVAISEKSGKIYVTEDSTGRLIELRPKVAVDTSDDMLARTIYSSEVSSGRAPAKWPDFIESFVNELGVATEDEHPGMERNAKGEIIKKKGEKFTLEQFTDKVPMVAGKLNVTNKISVESEDPVNEIHFMMLYPDSAITQNPYATPGLSLFAIKTESGKIIRTRMLTGYQQGTVNLGDEGVSDVKNAATLFVPLGNVSVMPAGREAKLTLSFMGIDMMDDFYIQLQTGNSEKGTLTVDAKRGSDLKESYEVSFIDKDEEGNKERNLVVAGFNRLKVNNFGWYKLGNAPVPNLLSMSEDFKWFSRRTAGIAKTVELREKAWRSEVVARNNEKYGYEVENIGLSERFSFKPTEVRDDLIPNPALAERIRKEQELQKAKADDDRREASNNEERRAKKEDEERRAKNGDTEREVKSDTELRKVEKDDEFDQAEIVEDEDEGEKIASTWTNIILTKAVELWQTAEF